MEKEVNVGKIAIWLAVILLAVFLVVKFSDVSGRAVQTSQKPSSCAGYFGDPICDDTSEDCGNYYQKGVSLDVCDECDTYNKEGKLGFDCKGGPTDIIKEPTKTQQETKTVTLKDVESIVKAQVGVTKLETANAILAMFDDQAVVPMSAKWNNCIDQCKEVGKGGYNICLYTFDQDLLSNRLSPMSCSSNIPIEFKQKGNPIRLCGCTTLKLPLQ